MKKVKEPIVRMDIYSLKSKTAIGKLRYFVDIPEFVAARIMAYAMQYARPVKSKKNK